MAREAGARLQGMDEVMMWHAAHLPDQEMFFGKQIGILVNPVVNNPHAILVNRAGERFVNEPSHKRAPGVSPKGRHRGLAKHSGLVGL